MSVSRLLLSRSLSSITCPAGACGNDVCIRTKWSVTEHIKPQFRHGIHYQLCTERTPAILHLGHLGRGGLVNSFWGAHCVPVTPHSSDPATPPPPVRLLQVGVERFQCPEVLFDPEMVGVESPGIHNLIHNTVQKCDIDVRRDLYHNCLLSGGSTCFEGLPQRLLRELQALSPPSCKVRVTSPPERRYSVWIGGAILAALPTFQNMWISKDLYEEVGPDIVHKMCF